MRYPLSVMKIKSSNSSPGVDWEALDGEAAGEMISVHPAGDLGVSWIQTTISSISLGSSTRCCRRKVAFWASSFWQHVPPSRQLGGWCLHPAGREMAEISRGGCVGWENFSGAWSLAGLTSKAFLDDRRWRTTLIYSYSFFPHSCVATSPPAGPSEENPTLCCLWIQPWVMLLGLLSSYLSQHSKTHTHNVLLVVGAEGRLGKCCPKCISAGRLHLIVLFCGLVERTLFFQEYIHMLISCSWQGSGLPPVKPDDIIIIINSQETPHLPVPWDKGLWLHVTPGRCNEPAGKAWGNTYRYREPSSKWSLLWVTPSSPNTTLSFGLVCLSKEMVLKASSWNKNEYQVH